MKKILLIFVLFIFCFILFSFDQNENYFYNDIEKYKIMVEDKSININQIEMQLALFSIIEYYPEDTQLSELYKEFYDENKKDIDEIRKGFITYITNRLDSFKNITTKVGDKSISVYKILNKSVEVDPKTYEDVLDKLIYKIIGINFLAIITGSEPNFNNDLKFKRSTIIPLKYIIVNYDRIYNLIHKGNIYEKIENYYGKIIKNIEEKYKMLNIFSMFQIPLDSSHKVNIKLFFPSKKLSTFDVHGCNAKVNNKNYVLIIYNGMDDLSTISILLHEIFNLYDNFYYDYHSNQENEIKKGDQPIGAYLTNLVMINIENKLKELTLDEKTNIINKLKEYTKYAYNKFPYHEMFASVGSFYALLKAGYSFNDVLIGREGVENILTIFYKYLFEETEKENIDFTKYYFLDQNFSHNYLKEKLDYFIINKIPDILLNNKIYLYGENVIENFLFK